jgi:hypothetical protein
MRSILIAAAATAALAAPAAAQTADAIAHFNADLSGNEIVRVVGDERVTVQSTRSGSVAEALAHFNADVDGQNAAALAGTEGVTLPPTNALGADVFAAIARENRDDD